MSTTEGGGGIIQDGLIFCIDAGNVKSYPGTGTLWTDLTKNRNNGTLTNGPTFSGDNGGRINFDAIDDYMDAPVTIQASADSGEQTFCGWLYGNTLYWNTPFGSNANGTGQHHITLGWESSTQIVYGGSYYGAGSGEVVAYANVVTNDSLYNYFSLVKVSAYTYNVYFNAEKVLTNVYRNSIYPTNFSLGRWWDGFNLSATIPMTQIYNRVLTDKEILHNYNVHKTRFSIP